MCRRLKLDLADDVDARRGRVLKRNPEIFIFRLSLDGRDVETRRLQDDRVVDVSDQRV